MKNNLIKKILREELDHYSWVSDIDLDAFEASLNDMAGRLHLSHNFDGEKLLEALYASGAYRASEIKDLLSAIDYVCEYMQDYLTCQDCCDDYVPYDYYEDGIEEYRESGEEDGRQSFLDEYSDESSELDEKEAKIIELREKIAELRNG